MADDPFDPDPATTPATPGTAGPIATARGPRPGTDDGVGRTPPVAVLLDIDGTLVAIGDAASRAAFDRALAAVHGVPATIDGVPLGGMLDLAIARLALAPHGVDDRTSDARFGEVAAATAAHYATLRPPGSRIDGRLPGVPDLLVALAERGASIGVVTGNSEPLARAKLAAAGLDGLLPWGAYGDTTHDRAELVALGLAAASAHEGTPVDPTRSVVVGDTPRDVTAARAVGLRVVAVATGAASAAALAAAEPDVLLGSLADVDAAVEAILER